MIGLDIQLVNIVKALLSNCSVKHLFIGKNLSRIKYSNYIVVIYLLCCALIRNPGDVLSGLVSLINRDTTKLESLSLADSKLRDHTVTLLDGLGLNHCITKLDIR